MNEQLWLDEDMEPDDFQENIRSFVEYVRASGQEELLLNPPLWVNYTATYDLGKDVEDEHDRTK